MTLSEFLRNSVGFKNETESSTRGLTYSQLKKLGKIFILLFQNSEQNSN